MKKSILSLTLFIFIVTTIFAQGIRDKRASNFTLSSEFSTWILAGSASINFEGLLVNSDDSDFLLYARVGLVTGFIQPIFCKKDNFKGKLVGLTLLSGRDNHKFEFSTGVYSISENQMEKSFLCTPRKRNLLPLVDIGYRYQNTEGGFIFKAKASVLGLGVGIGYAF